MSVTCPDVLAYGLFVVSFLFIIGVTATINFLFHMCQWNDIYCYGISLEDWSLIDHIMCPVIMMLMMLFFLCSHVAKLYKKKDENPIKKE